MIPNEQDAGPYRIDLVFAIWSRIARTADALHAIGALGIPSSRLREVIEHELTQGNHAVDLPDLTRTLRVLAAQDGMHAGDWLRSRAVEAQMPRRKPPAPLDLQIRLKGLQCIRFVAQLVERTEDDGTVVESHRVTIRNTRGDVASCESSGFANALEGALKMAGARAEQEDS